MSTAGRMGTGRARSRPESGRYVPNEHGAISVARSARHRAQVWARGLRRPALRSTGAVAERGDGRELGLTLRRGGLSFRAAESAGVRSASSSAGPASSATIGILVRISASATRSLRSSASTSKGGWCMASMIAARIFAPRGVRPTSLTRRSPGTGRRSTRPWLSNRSTTQVALDASVQQRSASARIGLATLASIMQSVFASLGDKRCFSSTWSRWPRVRTKSSNTWRQTWAASARCSAARSTDIDAPSCAARAQKPAHPWARGCRKRYAPRGRRVTGTTGIVERLELFDGYHA